MKVQWLLPGPSEVVNSFPNPERPECSHPALLGLGTEPHLMSDKKIFFPLLENAHWEGMRPRRSSK